MRYYKREFLSPDRGRKYKVYQSDIEIIDLNNEKLVTEPETMKKRNKQMITAEQLITSKKDEEKDKFIKKDSYSYQSNYTNKAILSDSATNNYLAKDFSNRNLSIFKGKENPFESVTRMNVGPSLDDSKSVTNEKKEYSMYAKTNNINKETVPVNMVVNNNNIIIENQQNYNVNNNYLVIKTPVDINDTNQIKEIFTNMNQETSPKLNQRYDRRGVAIEKGKKNHKVTYIDKVDRNKNLVTVSHIESHKKYLEVFDETRNKSVGSEATSCCIII